MVTGVAADVGLERQPDEARKVCRGPVYQSREYGVILWEMERVSFGILRRVATWLDWSLDFLISTMVGKVL